MRSCALQILMMALFVAPAVSFGGLGGAIYGVVKDAETGWGVDNAYVEITTGLGNIKLNTLPSGHYSAFAPEGRGYNLKVTKEGYLPAYVSGIKVVANDFMEYNVTMEPIVRKSTLEQIARAAKSTSKFRIIKPVQVWLVAPNGRYVCADPNKGYWLFATEASPEACEPFVLMQTQVLRGGANSLAYALLAPNTRYVRVLPAGPLVADRKTFDADSVFTPFRSGRDSEDWIGSDKWRAGKPIRVALLVGPELKYIAVTSTGIVRANIRGKTDLPQFTLIQKVDLSFRHEQ